MEARPEAGWSEDRVGNDGLNTQLKQGSERNLEVKETGVDIEKHGSQVTEQLDVPTLQIDTLGQRFLFASLFVIKGFSDLFFWNCLISILFVLREQIYTKYPTVTDTLNAANNITSIAAVTYTIKTGAMNQNVIMAAGVIQGICCFLVAITVQCNSGLAGVILLHIWSAIAGVCSGLYQGGGMGLASVMPKPMVHFISAGQGTCGVLTFLLWMLVSKTGLAVRKALWVLMSLGLLTYCLATASYFYLIRIPYISMRIKQVQKSLRDEATNPNAPSYMFLFKQIWLIIICIWFTMFSTLLIFPNIGPMQWRDGDKTDYVFGAFQFGDCIGRYIATLCAVLVMGVRTSFVFSMARGLFIIALSVAIWRVHANHFFRSLSFHIVLMAFLAMTEGYLISVTFINFPKVVTQKDWTSRASSMTLFAILFGITCGLWFARLLTGVIPNPT